MDGLRTKRKSRIKLSGGTSEELKGPLLQREDLKTE